MNTDIDFSIEMFFKEFTVDYSDTKLVYVNGLKYFNNRAQEFLGDEWNQE